MQREFLPKLMGERKDEISDEALQTAVYDTVDQEISRLKAILGYV